VGLVMDWSCLCVAGAWVAGFGFPELQPKRRVNVRVT